jgi:peptide/nickel transport system ATP-binding protein
MIGAPILEVRDLTVDFPTDDGIVHAVRGVSFEVGERDVLGIVGESGCGKSVTSLAVMGLLPRSARVSGSVRFRGQELVGASKLDMRHLRGSKIAMIFQDPMTAMNPVYTVGWQISEAIRAHHEVQPKAAFRQAIELLDMVGIPRADRRAQQYPHEFSGGMRQRAMIAMAIANNPDIIIADEPTTALDVTVQAQVLETLVRLKNELSAAIILITHDLGVVAGMVDTVKVMYAGRVVETGSVDDVFYKPSMPYTIGLLGSIPSAHRDGERLTPIGGSPPSLINVPPGCPFSSRCPLVRAECLVTEPAMREISADHQAACIALEEIAEMDEPLSMFHAAAGL